ncbi:MAG: sigma-70 family RNA polymerase sigma factor [Saprospiraceae bacterium]
MINPKPLIPVVETRLMCTDTELITAASEGDDNAFRLLVERYQNQVNATVIGMLGNVTEADDVAQGVFIRFYQSLDKFRGESGLGTYLTRIAINLSLNELKRRQRRFQRFFSFQKSEKPIDLPDRSETPERLDDRDLIANALQQLEPDFRSIVVLRLVDGYSVKETAEMLDLPMGTVASRLARAQLKLKTILKGD